MSEVKAVRGKDFDNQTPNLPVQNLCRMEIWKFSVFGGGEEGIVFTLGYSQCDQTANKNTTLSLGKLTTIVIY